MPEPAPSPSRFVRTLRKLGPAGPLAFIAATLPPVSGILLFACMGTVSGWLRAHGTHGLAIYTLAFALLAGLAVLPTYAQAVLGGFAFGMLQGTPAALVAFTLGAGLGTEVARRATGDRVLKLLAEKPRWLAVRNTLVREQARGPDFWRTTGLVALVRVPPNSPFALTNLLLASVQVPRGPLWLGTLLGMAPRTIAAVWIGSQLEHLTSKADIANATPRWLAAAGIAAGVAALLAVGYVANRALKKATACPAGPAQGPSQTEPTP